ncbi:hypothetical protein SLA2020_233220 [Shorea laevis]
MNLGLTLPSLVEVELKGTASVLQQIAHPTNYDTKINNLDNKFHLNLNLALAQPAVACEVYQAPSMGLFGTEADNFNPVIVVNLDLTLAPAKVN